MGWVLRVFQSQERSLMLTLLKSLIIPLLEYCCQRWNPWKAKDIQAIEAIQRTFTYKITEVQHLNYWERLHELKFHSLQRLRERYMIIYIWKITQHMVPNIDGAMGHTIKTRKDPINTWNTVRYSVSNKQKPSTIPSRECSNYIWGSVVPLVAKISDWHRKRYTEKFKFELDKFLELIPDQPKMPNFVTASEQ